MTTQDGQEQDPIGVVIADDHELFRAGLRGILERQPRLRVLGEAADGAELLKLVADVRPHVALVDVTMPKINGIEAVRQIIATHGPDATRVLMLTMHAEHQFVTAALEAGASGYVLKNTGPAELLTAICRVRAGQQYLSGGASGSSATPRTAQPFGGLTPRERQVLQHVAEGLSNKQIADAMDISVKTVDTHRQQIMARLGIRSVAELTRYAVRAGLTPP